MSENLGGIDITIALDTAQLLDGAKDVQNALSQIDSSSKKTGGELDGLDKSTSQTGAAFTELAGYTNSMDNQLRKLNTNVSGIAKAMEEARSGTGGANSEFNRAQSIIEALGNQLAVLDEAQENGARSAAVLAAQLRAGSKATEEEKQKIGELTGNLFDMQRATTTSTGGNKSWKSSMQAAGYQVQDFIVQVQGGQSALVAFSQQGSQLAGAFGPGGAVIGALIALGSVVAGVLITSLNGGKNAMDALKDAAEAMDKVISISSQGVAALSDKYAALARVNADVATLLRNQALLEYNQAISKIPKAISDASDAFVTLGDRALAAVGGASPSIKKFNDELAALGVTSRDWGEAIQQANSQGQYASGVVSSLSSTVSILSSRLGVSKQSAFDLAQQLSELSNNPSPEALQDLAKKLQEMKSSSKDGQSAIAELAGKLVDLAREAANAKINVDSLNKATDNLTAGQQNLIKQSERNLALSKLQGEARAKLQAQYAAEDAGFAKDDPHAKKMEEDAAATYKNTEEQKKLKSEQKKGAAQAETIAQKLEKLKQESELAAGSTKLLTREQQLLAAEQSLGAHATEEQKKQARDYKAASLDAANALKAQAAAEKLLPEARENASYKQDVEDLNTALASKKISQEQYNQTSERLEATHQANLSKIRAQQAVTPQQEAVAQVDPVQQLANQHAQQLALIQQFEQQGLLAHQNALALKNAADTQYEQQRTAAQWELLSQQSLGYNMLTSAVDAFAGNASNALTGLLTGTMSAQDALRSLGNTILNSVINSMVQMGVEALKNMIIGQTIGAASSAASIAQAALVSSAWAPAAAMASLATLGGNAAPAAAGISSTVALASGLALTGMRYNGGPVNAGGLYQVGERGKPEIYQASTGKQYMIPGDNGKVISNKDMQGGGGVNVIIKVQNMTGATFDAQATSNGDGTITVDAIIADLNNGGPISQGITSNFNAKRTPRGQN